MRSSTAQRVLRMLVGHTALGGQLQRHVKHLLVQKRHAQLKRMRHGHAVGLQANVIRHVRHHVHVLRLRDNVATLRLHSSFIEVRLAPFPRLARAVVALQHVGHFVPHIVHARALVAFLRAARTTHGKVTPMERRQLLGHRTTGGAQGTRHLEVLREFVLVVVNPVATKQLVGTFAGLHHFYFLGSQLADEIQRDSRRRAKRLVHVILLGGHDIQKFLGRNLHVLVGQPRPLRKLVRVFQLVKLNLEACVFGLVALLFAAGDVVAHRERFHALLVVLAHAVRSQGAVDAARQEAANLNIGNLVRAHALIERVLDDVGPFLKAFRMVNLVRDLVEAFDGGLAVLEHHEVAGRHLMHVLEHGLRVVQVLEAQVLRQRLAVQLLLKARVRQKRLDFAAVHQALAVMLIVQRLDAKDVARQHQLLFTRIPNSNGEHAAQTLEHARAPCLVAMYHRFGVAMRFELVTHALKLGAQLLEVVNLAVERNGYAAIGVLHRLTAAFQVDDRQAPKAHCNVVVYKKALVIRAAMDNAIRHVLHDCSIGLLVEVNSGETYESAHALCKLLLFSPQAFCILPSYATALPYGHFPRNARDAYAHRTSCAIMQGCKRISGLKELP